VVEAAVTPPAEEPPAPVAEAAVEPTTEESAAPAVEPTVAEPPAPAVEAAVAPPAEEPPAPVTETAVESAVGESAAPAVEPTAAAPAAPVAEGPAAEAPPVEAPEAEIAAPPAEPPSMADFIRQPPAPATGSSKPVVDARPARREPRIGKLLPRMAPLLDEEFARAAAELPVEEAAPPPAAGPAPPPATPVTLRRVEPSPRPARVEPAAAASGAPPDETTAPRLHPVEPSPRVAAPRRRPLAPGQVTYSDGLRARFLIIGLLILVVTGATVAGVLYFAQRHKPQVLQFAVPPPEHTTYPGTPAVSPDGLYLVFSAVGPEGKRMLWLRPLDSLHATVIQGTEGGFAPFWSPDSQQIGFFADKALKKVRASGGSPRLLCEVETFTGGGAWNRDNTILFAPGLHSGLYRVHAEGGRPEPVTEIAAGSRERAHLWPRFLPDGKYFIFYVLTDFEESSGVYLGSLDSRQTRRIIQSDSNAVFSASRSGDVRPNASRKGYLLFIRNRNLYGQKFNGSDVEGTPLLVAGEVGSVRSMALAPVSVSDNGVLVYQMVGKANRQLIWFDRSGKQLASLGAPAEFGLPRISPDGKKVLVGVIAPGQEAAELWLIYEDGASSRLTPVAGGAAARHEAAPIWSADGTRFAYASDEEGRYNLYSRTLGSAKTELLVKSDLNKFTNDWSRDGRYILFGSIAQSTKSDLMVAQTADRRVYPVAQTIDGEGYGAFSPDGRWIAFQCDAGNRSEVYVQAFRAGPADPPRRYKVSADGGGLPRWRRDGKELYYITETGRLMAVAVRPGDATFECDAPQQLFQTRCVPRLWNLFDAAADGQRFLVNVPLEWSSAAPITVVTNWTEKVRQ
jgi:Tol biopolymer transport system component